MSLSHHIRTMHALGDAFEGQAGQTSIEDHGLLLMSIATAYRVAAREVELHSRAEAETFSAAHRCTVVHAVMKTPVCPVCGARR